MKPFSELVEMSKIKKLMDSLYDLTGIGSTLVDPESNIIATCGWKVICAKFHRAHAQTESRCRESVRNVNINIDKPYFGYKCLNGLYDYLCPITVNGQHIATLVAGQVFIEPPDEKFFCAQARNFGFDKTEYIEALRQIPIVEEEKIGKIIKVYADFASIVAELGVQRVQQNNAMFALKESETKYRNLFDHMSNGFVYLKYTNDIGYEILETNQAFYKLTGLEKEEILSKKLSETSLGLELQGIEMILNDVRINRVSRTFENPLGKNKKWFRLSAYSPQIEHIALVIDDIDEQKRNEEQVQYEARHDTLTGLWNRRIFENRLDDAVELAKRRTELIAVAYLDLDNFKPINDKWGHMVGDDLLKQVARRIEECVRKHDTLARFGGDEFVLLLSDLKSHDEAKTIANRILDACRTPFIINENRIVLSVSLGLSFFPDDGVDYSSLVRSADAAMYEAKRRGRNSLWVNSRN